MRKTPFLSEKVRYLPCLLPRAGSWRQDPGRKEGKLVKRSLRKGGHWHADYRYNSRHSDKIRNASSARHATVDVPASNVKKAITQILLDEGYIKGFQVIEDGKQGVIRITLKYTDNRSPVITGLRRVSKPGLRIYSSCEDMPKVRKDWVLQSFLPLRAL